MINETTSILNYIGPTIYGFTQVVLLVFCFIFLIKSKNTTASILLLIGTLISLIANIAQPIILSLNSTSVENIILISSIVSIIKSIAYSIFIFGLCLLILDYLKKLDK